MRKTTTTGGAETTAAAKPSRTIIEHDAPLEVVVEGEPRRYCRVHADVVRSGLLADLTGSAVKVLLALSAHASRETWLAWPSVSTLSTLTGVSRGQVFRALDELKAAGLIEERAKGGGARATTYELTPPPAPKPRPRRSSPSKPEHDRGLFPAEPPPEPGRTRLMGATGRAGATGSAGAPDPSHGRDGGGRAGATLTTRRELREATTTTSAAALLLVEGAGFPPSDAQALVDESGADEARVRDALDSLQAVRARKAVPSPRGYLATFLRNGWALDAAVAERRDADRRRAGQADRQRAREHAAAKRRADEQAEALEAGREVRRRLDAASDDDLERARAEVLREMPGRFGRLFDRLNLRGELHGPEAAFAFSVAQRLARNETAPSPAKAAGSRGGKVGATGATA